MNFKYCTTLCARAFSTTDIHSQTKQSEILFARSEYLTSDLCPVEVHVDLVRAGVIGRVGDLEESRGGGFGEEGGHPLAAVGDVHAKVALTRPRAVHCRLVGGGERGNSIYNTAEV